MSSVGNILLDQEILLESGTNELEVLVFDVADYCFGINVAKVREVLPAPPVTALPQAHSSVRGVFRLREVVVPCVSLLDHLEIPPSVEHSESTLILTDFNNQQTAFFVDEVERIHRINWEQVLPMPPIDALANTPVTGVIRCDGRLIVMLDFEMIINQVTDQVFCIEPVDNPRSLPRHEMRIVVVDDSPTIRQTMDKTLRANGYTQLEILQNGAEAWNWLETRSREISPPESVADLVISDVEMPQVDGLHLTKRIKQHPKLKQIPVILYSSIVTPDNHKKGEAVGADMQVSKLELNNVVRLADDLIGRTQDDASRAVAPGGAPDSPVDAGSASQETPSESDQSSAPSIPKNPAPAESSQMSNTHRPTTAAQSSPKQSTDPFPKLSGRPMGDVISELGPVWLTFQTELTGRADEIREYLEKVENQIADASTIHGMFRVLHSVKSASMVIAIDPITRLTHQIETLLESIRDGHLDWTESPFVQFAEWLDDVAQCQGDAAEHWGSAETMQTEYQDLITRCAASV